MDTSRTVGGRVVSPEVAQTRAEVRRITTVGAGYLGGTVPWFAGQAIDKRSVAGALLSGGAFLPLFFGGPSSSSTPDKPGSTPEGRRRDDGDPEDESQ